MKIHPLAVFTGLALATLGALVFVERDKWMGEPSVLAKVDPAPVAEAPKAEVPAKVDAPASKTEIVPTFDTVRVEPNGNTVIAGRAEPGAEVTIKYNGLTVGTGVANADGAFVVTPEKPLPTGPGALSIETKNKDAVVASADSVAVDVKGGGENTPMVAVLNPDKPTTLIQMPNATKPVLPPMKTVNLDTVDYDESGNIVFGGRGPAGSKVQVYVDNNPFGLAVVGPEGTWTMPGTSPLAIGAHELRADEIGADGTVTSRVGMPFYREDPKRVASAAPVDAPAAPVAAAAPAAPAVQVTMVDKTVEPAKAPETPDPATAVAAAPVVEPPKVEAPAAAEAPKVDAPAAPAVVAAATPAQPPEPTKVIIQPGNNLWKLSRKIYGKGTMYTVIYEANKDQIRKPGLIYPGQVFLTPDAAKAQ
jgi:nucleoid-associated protein YgaU